LQGSAWIFVSGYPSALRVAAEQRPETKLDVPDAALTEVISARLPDSGLTLWLVDSPSCSGGKAAFIRTSMVVIGVTMLSGLHI
jgi:hypothetical protein